MSFVPNKSFFAGGGIVYFFRDILPDSSMPSTFLTLACHKALQKDFQGKNNANILAFRAPNSNNFVVYVAGTQSTFKNQPFLQYFL